MYLLEVEQITLILEAGQIYLLEIGLYKQRQVLRVDGFYIIFVDSDKIMILPAGFLQKKQM